MNLNEWRKAQKTGEELTLPSGLAVRVGKITLMDVLESGDIPGSLNATVERAITSGELPDETLEDVQRYREFVTFMAGKALRGPDGLDVTELPWTDRQFIFAFLTGAQDRVRPFRGEANEPVGSVQPGDGLRPATE